jgi:hypothetical protein
VRRQQSGKQCPYKYGRFMVHFGWGDITNVLKTYVASFSVMSITTLLSFRAKREIFYSATLLIKQGIPHEAFIADILF